MSHTTPETEIANVGGDTADIRDVTGNSVNQTDAYSPSAPYTAIGRAAPTVDGDGNMLIRGDVLTDEGQFRDDFSGTSLSVDWTTATSLTGAIAVANSLLTLSSGATNGAKAEVMRPGDYGPLTYLGLLSISQRVANQTIFFGLRNDATGTNIVAEFRFSGTVNTAATCVSSSFGTIADTDTTQITLPNGLTTASSLKYQIDVQPDRVSFFIEDILVATHVRHMPGPYQPLMVYQGIKNTAAASNTSVAIDFVYFPNYNTLSITNPFESSPVNIISKEDSHYISGVLTSSATTANQTILSYTVPAGKVAYIVGFMLSSTNVDATVAKIGVNSVTTEPVAPGTVDSSIFRAFFMAGKTNFSDSFFSARRIARGGDILLFTVTPAAAGSTLWRATIDLILR